MFRFNIAIEINNESAEIVQVKTLCLTARQTRKNI